MKALFLGIAVSGLLISGISSAQTTQGTNPAGPVPTMTDHGKNTAAASGDNNQAVATTNANALMPAKGSNSFTMSEVKSRIEKNGFSNVSGLTKDNNGVWHGTAQKGGMPTMVWLDYKGNTGESK